MLNLSAYIRQLKSNENKDTKIAKYIYLVNNYNIHIIYTKTEFTYKYNDIVKILDKNTNDQTINYYIHKHIINILFDKILNY